MKSSLLKKFPNDPQNPVVVKGEGVYLYLDDGRRILDATSGWCGQNVLGYSHPEVLASMRDQMDRFCHIDSNRWVNPLLEELGALLLSQAPPELNKVYFCGTSGSEAVEAAMKISFQKHFNLGKKSKTMFISRDQSYHGATLHGIAMSSLDIFEFYSPLLPAGLAKIPVHYPLRCMKHGESLDEYALRGALELENEILRLGPENVCAFVAETMLGSLLGDVPPAPGYWQHIRGICDKYDVHLILDEVYCGLGRSGKIYCCTWDGIVPDFICVAKALGGGHAPISAVITNDSVENAIKNGQGRINTGHTHQGYSLGCAAGLAIQKIVHRPETLAHVIALGERMRYQLSQALGDHPLVRSIHGRGSMFSIEYQTRNNSLFSQSISKMIEHEFNVLVSAKWHRISFSLPFILTFEEADRITEAVIRSFQKVSSNRELFWN
jgi:adenosylmethionine-8-amino-7-oxononanoate aminotransferase